MTMGRLQEDTIRAFLAAWGDEQHRPDVDRIVSMFAPNGQWTLYVPNGPVIRGREALRAEIERQLAYVAWTECGLLHIVSDDRRVVTERADRFCKNGHVVSHALMAVYELDDDGLITDWREYFDTYDLAKQSGSTPGQLSGLEAPAPVAAS
jgi:limonene-1,2-epoxide hydrolase